MSDRDKFLTECMGECWHEFKEGIHIYCQKCNKPHPVRRNFSTWEGFGKLWEWAQGQKWFIKIWPFLSQRQIALIHPDRFADAVYDFLKEC